MKKSSSYLRLLAFAILITVPGRAHTAEAQTPLFSMNISPAMSVPFGTSLDLFRFVGGAAVSGEFRMPFFTPLSIEGGLGYTFFQIRNATAAEQSLSMISMGANLGIQLDLLPVLNLKLFAGGGYEYGFSNDVTRPQSGGGSFLEAGTRLSWYFLPDFGLGLGLAYRYEFGLFQGLVASLGAGIRFTGGPGEILELGDVQFPNVFPVLHKYYDDHVIGTATLTNTGSYAATNIALSLEIKPFMTAPKQCTVQQRLEPGRTSTIDMYALFSEEQLLAITEGTKASAEITWDYMVNGVKKTGKKVETIRILNRNAVTWEDDRMVAAFVTALDPAVMTFSKNVSGAARTVTNRAMNPKVLTAIALYEALCQYGMKYVIDPKSSYASMSQDAAAIDFVQFPQQTLQYKGGDCDDLSVLYCALFESVGIASAFITVPGHIYMAFSLGMSPEEAQRSFLHSEDLIFVGDAAWFPIEVTSLDGKFLEAWQLGAKEWREADAAGGAVLYPLSYAWETYEPVGLIGGSFNVAVPRDDLVVAAFKRELQRVVDLEIYPQISKLEAEIEQDPGNIGAMNKLGVLYAKYDLLDKAEKQFLAVLDLQDYAPALLNLGNISYIRKDIEGATGYYERAYENSPDDAKVIACLARCYWESANYGPVDGLYQRLTELDSRLAEQFAYLSQQGPAAGRAADPSGTREEVLWGDE